MTNIKILNLSSISSHLLSPLFSELECSDPLRPDKFPKAFLKEVTFKLPQGAM